VNVFSTVDNKKGILPHNLCTNYPVIENYIVFLHSPPSEKEREFEMFWSDPREWLSNVYALNLTQLLSMSAM